MSKKQKIYKAGHGDGEQLCARGFLSSLYSFWPFLLFHLIKLIDFAVTNSFIRQCCHPLDE